MYIKAPKNSFSIEDRVVLTEEKEAITGKFTQGSIVTITGIDQMRGYDIEDDEGNKLIECGFTGFELLADALAREE